MRPLGTIEPIAVKPVDFSALTKAMSGPTTFSGFAKAMTAMKDAIVEVGRVLTKVVRGLLRFLRRLRWSLAREARGGNQMAKMLLASLGNAGLPAGLRYAPQIRAGSVEGPR